MKRGISFVLVLVMCLSLCACGKSQAVKDVEQAIDAIGEVSLDSNDVILKAERLYDNLTDSEKAEVANKALLVEARFTYDRFYNDKVYSIAKKAYELLCEAEKLYCYESGNMHRAGEFGKTNKMGILDNEFCKKFADATMDYQNYPKLTEQDVRDAIDYYYQEFNTSGNIEADMVVCMNIFLQGMYDVRNYYPYDLVQEAGALLQELTDTYKDEKYYPVLVEYRDFVATGHTIKMKNIHKLLDGFVEYQSKNSQYEAKIAPMFAD